MTAADLGDPGAGLPPRDGAPRAVVGRAALARNARLAVAAVRPGEPAIVDLRADAWGHGDSAVAAAVTAAGAIGVRVDAHRVPVLAAAFRGVSADAAATVDTRTLLGLPGGARGATPAMTLLGTVLSTKDLRAGEGVSYGYRYRAASDTRVALVTGGYAQGIVRSLGGRASMLIGGKRHPIVGRIAMDVCVVEIGDARIARGDEAVLLGDPEAGAPSLAEWAAATGMRASELITAVGLRNAREYAP